MIWERILNLLANQHFINCSQVSLSNSSKAKYELVSKANVSNQFCTHDLPFRAGSSSLISWRRRPACWSGCIRFSNFSFLNSISKCELMLPTPSPQIRYSVNWVFLSSSLVASVADMVVHAYLNATTDEIKQVCLCMYKTSRRQTVRFPTLQRLQVIGSSVIQDMMYSAVHVRRGGPRSLHNSLMMVTALSLYPSLSAAA